MGPDNIYDKIQELLGDIPGNLSILEQQIDADTQLEYYNYSKEVEENFNPDEVLRNRNLLFRSDLAVQKKKQLIVQLANIDNIEAYRTLERYSKDSPNKLKDWATLALKENRLLIESKLLDKSQILISTGLGGKGMKLRYFTVILSTDGEQFSDFEKKIIRDEVNYSIKRTKGELENIYFDKEICTVLSVIPLQVPVQHLFNECIRECNQYGDFINTDYFITNVKIIPNDQIRYMINNSRKKTKPGNK